MLLSHAKKQKHLIKLRQKDIVGSQGINSFHKQNSA